MYCSNYHPFTSRLGSLAVRWSIHLLLLNSHGRPLMGLIIPSSHRRPSSGSRQGGHRLRPPKPQGRVHRYGIARDVVMARAMSYRASSKPSQELEVGDHGGAVNLRCFRSNRQHAQLVVQIYLGAFAPYLIEETTIQCTQPPSCINQYGLWSFHRTESSRVPSIGNPIFNCSSRIMIASLSFLPKPVGAVA